jgi:hypothetical protein
MKKALLPGILGGLLVFVWSAFAHMVLPIGEMGLKKLPSNNEEAALNAMKSNIQQSGLYFMPGIDMSRNQTDAEKNAWQSKYEAGPTAFLVYQTTGVKPISPGQLIRQALFNILCGLIAAFIISTTVASLAVRGLIGLLMGLFAWMEVNLPYWNWYRFPGDFTLGAGLDTVIAWLLGGFLIAWLIQRAEKRAAV